MKKYSYKEVLEKVEKEIGIKVQEKSHLAYVIDALMTTIENENGISEEVMFEDNLNLIINYCKKSLKEQMTKSMYFKS